VPPVVLAADLAVAPFAAVDPRVVVGKKIEPTSFFNRLYNTNARRVFYLSR
jgi:hypothetical protein